MCGSQMCFLIIIILCMCMSAYEDGRKVTAYLELELQAMVSCLIAVLRIKPESSAKTICAFNIESPLQPKLSGFITAIFTAQIHLPVLLLHYIVMFWKESKDYTPQTHID